MKDRAVAAWDEGMAFDVRMHGHHFPIDAMPEVGGADKGPRPKGLLLASLAGCTGMDVVSILRKMRMQWDSFAVEVDGDLTSEHPKVFTNIQITYRFVGAELDRKKIERAVELSQTTYCGVTAMLAKAVKIEHQIVLETPQG